MSVLAELVDGRELTEAEATNFMEELMSGEISEGEAAAYLTALRIRGETPLEIASFAKVMRAHAVQVKPNVKNLVDVVGTGGDCKN
ncbi:MAG TPA: anthranilate phosphoribosyltransferase, partial [Candidatus Altiarchaeales archaeon]|nr:anthranilate phosphoribosyltransferase [Candidatus Altiarchaeales archaeon]